MSTFTLLHKLLCHHVVWLCRSGRYLNNILLLIFCNLIKKALLFYFLSSLDLLTKILVNDQNIYFISLTWNVNVT